MRANAVLSANDETPSGQAPHSGPRRHRTRSRRGEGAELRTEILDVAEALLYETAEAEAVSIRAIGHRVGVSAPSIYRHFPDKDELIRAVCLRGFERMHQLFDQRLAGIDDPIERIMCLARAYADFGLGNPAQYRVLLMSPNISHHDSATPAPSFDDRAEEMGGLHRLVTTVEAAMDAECFARQDPWPIAFTLWSAVHGIVSLRIVEPNLPWPPVDQQLNMLFTLLKDGLLRRTVGIPDTFLRTN